MHAAAPQHSADMQQASQHERQEDRHACGSVRPALSHAFGHLHPRHLCAAVHCSAGRHAAERVEPHEVLQLQVQKHNRDREQVQVPSATRKQAADAQHGLPSYTQGRVTKHGGNVRESRSVYYRRACLHKWTVRGRATSWPGRGSRS